MLLGVCLTAGALAPCHAGTDFNGDGLCDVWQQRFNGWDLPAAADSDGDGHSNAEEALAGTHPLDPGDHFQVGEVAVNGEAAALRVLAAAGKRYQLHRSASPAGPWQAESEPVTGSGAELAFLAPLQPAADRQFYRVEVRDQDSDDDGVSDWAESVTGTDPLQASSPTNASGGAASDAATLASLFSLTVATVAGQEEALEREGTRGRIRFTRSPELSAMPLTLAFAALDHPNPAKGTAGSADVQMAAPAGNITGSTAGTLTLPAGVAALEVEVTPVADSLPEVPELLTLNVIRPGSSAASAPLGASVLIRDADPADESNRSLFVAYLGREAGVSTTATGIATALVQGDNDGALVNLTFSNLTSAQNTAYIRIDSDLEVLNVGLGQVSGRSWPIRAAQTRITDQAMLNALHAGELYISVTTADNPTGEIRGYFNRATGSTQFDYDPALHDAPAYGSDGWPAVAGAAIDRDIHRFLEQCTFGPTAELVAEVRAEVDAAIAGGQGYLKGLENWLDRQLDPVQTPNPSLLTLVQAADNEEFVLRGNKPLWSGNDPQFGELSYNVSYDAFGNPTVATTVNGTFNNNHPFHNNRRREQWTLALQAKAQVRQRMAMALSEIAVISENDATVQTKHYGAAAYWDMLAENGFGKYRDILEKITHHPMMGIYLSHLRNRATYVSGGVTISPDENYAREIMQLFSIGLVLRHPDGSLVLGEDGLPVPTYDNTDITELARVLTGLCHGARHATASVQRFNGLYFNASSPRVSQTIEFFNGSGFNIFNEGGGDSWWQAPWIYPMKMVGRIGSTVYHDFGQKTLLAGKHGQTVIPAQTLPATGGSNDLTTHTLAANDLALAHNCLAGNPAAGSYNGHQNTPVNLSRWLIQRFTSSNPSAGYLYRVSERYRQTNGQLGQVLKAILLDHEARSLQLADTGIGQGRMKEPMLHFMALVRALKGYTGVPLTTLRDAPVPFSSTDSPMSVPYPQSEVDKFVPNASRFRMPDTSGSLGQSPLKAPSVFNWFLPDYTVPGPISEAGLVMPEMQIATETNLVARINRLWSYTWMNLAGMTAFPGVDQDDVVQISGNAGPQVKLSNLAPATATENSFLDLRSFTFTPANWNTPQTVTVAAVDDSSPEGAHTTRLHHSTVSSDPAFNSLGVSSVSVTIQDNESAGNARVILTETGGDTLVVEGGATDTYTLQLSSAPSATVTIDLVNTINNIGSYPAEATFSPASLSFDAGNWNTPQTVTVTAANDTSSETPELTQIGHSIRTTDSLYRQAVAPALKVIVADNDNNGSNAVFLLQTEGTSLVQEGGSSDSYYYVLRRLPTGNVTVAINTGGDLAASPAALTFTTSNWNVPQKVTLTAVDDALAEGAETFSVSNVASGGSYSFSNNVSVSIQDNDGGSVVIAETNGGTSVNESSATTSNNPQAANLDTYTLRLGSAPSQNVTVTVTAERHPRPMSTWARTAGYYSGDLAGASISSNLQKDRLTFDYSELIALYNSAYGAAGGNASAAAAHFAGTLAVIDKLDLYLCGGQMRAQWPALTLADLSNSAVVHPRKSVARGVYLGFSTTRLSTDTANFNNEVRDRCRIAAYLMSLSPQSFNAR